MVIWTYTWRLVKTRLVKWIRTISVRCFFCHSIILCPSTSDIIILRIILSSHFLPSVNTVTAKPLTLHQLPQQFALVFWYCHRETVSDRQQSMPPSGIILLTLASSWDHPASVIFFVQKGKKNDWWQDIFIAGPWTETHAFDHFFQKHMKACLFRIDST